MNTNPVGNTYKNSAVKKEISPKPVKKISGLNSVSTNKGKVSSPKGLAGNPKNSPQTSSKALISMNSAEGKGLFDKNT